MWVTAQQGETLDALCYRVKQRTASLVEATLEANPGLAQYGPILPHGLKVNLPDLSLNTVRRTLQLWD